MAIKESGYIIPSRFYRGDLGKLRVDDLDAWRKLAFKDKPEADHSHWSDVWKK